MRGKGRIFGSTIVAHPPRAPRTRRALRIFISAREKTVSMLFNSTYPTGFGMRSPFADGGTWP
jgi:hypothetical protein